MSKWYALSVDLADASHGVSLPGPGMARIVATLGGEPLGVLEQPVTAGPLHASGAASSLASHFAMAATQHRLRSRHVPRAPVPALRATVLVCTRDRPDDLDRCLRSIRSLRHPVHEVLVVDNAPTSDRTAEVVERNGATYLREPVAGLDRARNRGLDAASGDVVLCTDDDAAVDPAWAGELLRAFDDPMVMAATGLVNAERLDTEAQVVFERQFGFGRGYEARTANGAYLSPYVAGGLGAGASMALRRDFAIGVGGFPEELDAGTPSRSGGDTYMLAEALRHGFRVSYVPSAMAVHRHRSTMPELRATIRGYGTGTVAYLGTALYRHGDLGAVTSGLAGYLRWLHPRLTRRLTGDDGAPPLHLGVLDLLGAAAALWRLPAARRRASRIAPAVSADASRLRALPRPVPQRPSAVTVDERPPVSVVVPSRGRRDRLVELLCVLERDRSPDYSVEYVVALDGDLDGSRHAVDTLELRRRVTVAVLPDAGNDPHAGAGAGPARNLGARLASHPVVVFLDDDVLPCDDTLLVRHADAHVREGPCAVIGACWPSTPAGAHRMALGAASWWADQGQRLRRGEPLQFNQFNTGNASVDRGSLLRLGGFPALPRSEDWAFGLQWLRAGLPLVGRPDAGVRHHVSDRPADAVRDRRLEGRGDVGMCDRIPEVLPWLRCGGLAVLRPRLRRLAEAAVDGRPLADRLLASVMRSMFLWPALGLVQREVQALNLAMLISYWRGVGDATGGLDGLMARYRRADELCVEQAVWDLAEPLPALDVGIAPRITIDHRGRPLGVADLRWGGVPFDRRRFRERVIRHFAADVHQLDGLEAAA